MKNARVFEIPVGMFLAFIILATLALAVPTIKNNADDPNMLVYMNADEGWQMDNAWYYYSGEKRPSFRIETDYGLVLVYITKFCKVFLSKFIDFTPGLLAVILRWFFLLSWVAALIALWNLVGYHFQKGWQQALSVSLLAVRPTFSYLCGNLKPDALMLFFMIVGLDYALRIIDKPSRKNILIALSFAALTMIVKYEGPFLLPPVIAALYFSKRLGNEFLFKDPSVWDGIFKKYRCAFAIPLIIGAVLIGLVLACVKFYVRQSTGMTWADEFGVIETIRQNRFMILALGAGFFAMIFGAALYFLRKVKNDNAAKVMSFLDEISSYALVTGFLFVLLTTIVGIKWVKNPEFFLLMIVPLGTASLGMGAIESLGKANFFSLYIQNLIHKITAFDGIVLALLIAYIAAEVYARRHLIPRTELFYKRMVLLVFLALPLAVMFSILWMAHHHMLPFYAVAVILAVQGIDMVRTYMYEKKFIYKIVFWGMLLLVFVCIFSNALTTIKSRLYQFRQKEDAAYQVRLFFRGHIPRNAVIVSAPHHFVYIPPEYKNVKVFDGFIKNDFSKFAGFIVENRPDYIYYDQGGSAMNKLPFGDIKEVLPDVKLEKAAEFGAEGRYYRRLPDDRFVIYRVKYR